MCDRIIIERPTNARPYDRVARRYPRLPESKRLIARFGSRAANSLLLLELKQARKLETGWDADWFQGEFLSRLRDVFFREPGVTEGMRVNFDWNAHLYQYESIDLLALDHMSRSRYRDLLLLVLRSIYDEENLGSPITATVRAVFRLPRF